MRYRTLGKTGLQVSEIGYGAWGIGQTSWIGADDQESLRALQRAIDLGVNFLDTALAYGNGHSEQLVGQVVRNNPGKTLYITTKVPPKTGRWPAQPGVPVEEVYPGDYIRSRTEESLRNLGVETIDLLQLHVWNDEWVGKGDWLANLQQLKEQGKIRFFGISTNDHQPENAIQVLESGTVDTVQVVYNIFDQRPEDRLFEVCQRKNIGVIVRVPLDEGGLTGKITPATTFDAGDFRNHYFQGDRKREVSEHVQGILADLGIDLDALPELALRYTLSHPAVSTVIPGMRSVRNAERNTALSDGKTLSAEQLQKLKKHRWIRNFYA